MPDNTYVLDYSDGQAFIQWPQPGVETIITARLKPDLGFPYAHLRFETATGQAFRTLDDAGTDVHPLTEEEIAACIRYCDDYPIHGDYPVQAYEAETGLYMGAMLKSEAETQGLAWIQGDDPDHPVSKLVDGEWVHIVALFMEDGHYRLLPDSTCPKCLVFLSQAEWDAWPKPTRSTEVWDFKTESWKDYRTLDQAKTTADDYIRNAYASKRRQLTGQIPAEEMATWRTQKEEAFAYKADPTCPTPFIDAMLATQAAMLAARDGGPAVPEPPDAKAALVEDILRHDEPDQVSAMGAVHGEMRGWILQVWGAETLDEVDALTGQVAEHLSISPLIRELSGF